MNMTSVSEMMLVVDAFEKDERILELERQIEDFKFTNNLLERERDQYKDMLDEIKELLNQKNVTVI
jgi:predicted patatin/cPLA2 family phospholipase